MGETETIRAAAMRLAAETGCAAETAERWLRGETVRGAAVYACLRGAERLGISPDAYRARKRRTA